MTHYPPVPDPTPDEIAARCATIQASWTPQDRLRRWQAARRLTSRVATGEAVETPVVAIRDGRREVRQAEY